MSTSSPDRGPAGLRMVAGAALLAVLALACNPQLLPPARAISGVLLLDQATPVERGGGDCRGTGGYADLRSGLEVVARDDSGTRMATTTLMAAPAPTNADGSVPQAERNRCVFRFGLSDMEERPAYRITIGERGGLRYTREELEAAGWTVELSLGR